MTSFDFDIAPLYDEKMAEEGIERTVILNDQNYGTYRLKYVDTFSTRGEVLRKRIMRLEAKRLGIKERDLTDMQAIRGLLCHAQLIGWSGIKAKGKEVPFSVEAALAFFSREDHAINRILAELAVAAGDSSNFMPEADLDEDQETPAGN